jgi:hypothetical protein
MAHERKLALTTQEHTGFNGWLAAQVTKAVGTMWCAYAFAGLAFVSLPAAIGQGTVAIISWISQTFLQLVLLSVIMVGQRVLAAASDKQAEQTFKDAEALLALQGTMRQLLETNTKLTEEIHKQMGCATPA